MALYLGIVIGASLWLVTEQQHPGEQACTSIQDIFQPCGCILSHETFDLTCGSDGHTYLSMCFLGCRMFLNNVKISVTHKGICSRESQCMCHAGQEPVCGTDGITYSNKCVLNCFMRQDSTIRLAHTGECDGRPPIILDSKEPNEPEKPDNQDKKPAYCCCYFNSRRHRARFGNNCKRYARSLCGYGCRHERKTEAPQKPPPVKLTAQPPSSTINNPQPIQRGTRRGCLNQSQACPLIAPVARQSENCRCAMILVPVCGNNNNTYVNFCVLHCTAKRNPSLEFQHWGVCGRKQ